MYKAFTELIEAEYDRRNLEWHISKITDNIDEVRNLLDTIPHQNPDRNRLNYDFEVKRKKWRLGKKEKPRPNGRGFVL